MRKLKYYLVDNGLGVPHEIYRGNAAYETFSLSCLERAKEDGSWADSDSEIGVLINLWLKGDFDPEEDEITEKQAMLYLDEWRNSGNWPSRK